LSTTIGMLVMGSIINPRIFISTSIVVLPGRCAPGFQQTLIHHGEHRGEQSDLKTSVCCVPPW
jgi:hypothetical protein